MPTGRQWRLKYHNLLAEAISGYLPVGGELKTYLETDVSGSFVKISESSFNTGVRVGYHGRGPIDHILTAGQIIRARVDLRSGVGLTFFYLASVELVEISV